MSEIEASGANSEQIEYWNGEAGTVWRERNDEMDAMLRPLGSEAIKRAAPTVGERILDIGCGCGGTTLDLADCVGPSGAVLGVDISAPMLSLANAKIEELAQDIEGSISFELADASSFEFPTASFDLLFSRFGVMFFADPTAAFANMRKALRPGGRLTFLCWGPVDKNEWILIPMVAASAHLPPPEPMDRRAPGPFAFSDTGYVTEILEAAGFTDVGFESTEPVMKMGDGTSLDKAAEFFIELGPVSRGLVDQPDSIRLQVKDAIMAAIADRYVDGFVELQGTCWIVSAGNPA